VPDVERCRKASLEGTSRVFEARGGDKPGLSYLASDLRDEITCIGKQDTSYFTCKWWFRRIFSTPLNDLF